MTQAHTGIYRPLTGTNYCLDTELMSEIVETVTTEVGDVRYDSGVLDTLRRQATFRLEDGRHLRITFMFE